MVLLGSYGALALIPTAIGIAGMVAYSVGRRTREIGLRVAFGATPASLLRMFSSSVLNLVDCGAGPRHPELVGRYGIDAGTSL